MTPCSSSPTTPATITAASWPSRGLWWIRATPPRASPARTLSAASTQRHKQKRRWGHQRGQLQLHEFARALARAVIGRAEPGPSFCPYTARLARDGERSEMKKYFL